MLNTTPNVITPDVVSSEYFIFYFRSVYNLSQFGVQIIESVIFLFHFHIRDPIQGFENYKHFGLETISSLHLASLHLALTATQNVITPNVISSEYSMS